MFRRFRRWFIEKYLPAYVTEANREDIAALQKEVARLSVELERERSYSAGLEYACRRRATVHISKEG